MKYITQLSICALVVLLIACEENGGSTTPQPEAASLIFPEDNTECNEGTIISETQSAVTFMWNASENTDSYTVNIRNLNTGQTIGFNTVNTQLQVTILRGTPYAWWVISSNSASETAQSEEWRFYNAGLSVENYAPFPAQIESPLMGTGVDASSGEVTLAWVGQDIDQDIIGYDVYFGTDNPPVNLESNTTTPTLNVAITSGEIYYWSVVTRDNEGNTSASEVFQFRAN